MKKQSLKKGLYSDIAAFEDMLKDPKQVPDEDNPKYWEVHEPTRKEGFNQELYTQDYLKSHIEIDAHAHDAAEELLALHGLNGSKRLLSKKIDVSDPKLPNALQHYLQHLPEDGKTIRILKKKIVSYLDYFAG